MLTGNFDFQHVMGFAGFLGLLLFLILGMKQYRDKYNGGVLHFGQAIKLGMLIILIPTTTAPIVDLVYTRHIDAGWFDDWYDYQVEQLEPTLSEEERAAEIRSLQEDLAMFDDPFSHFILMLLFTFASSVICTVIAAAIMQRKAAT